MEYQILANDLNFDSVGLRSLILPSSIFCVFTGDGSIQLKEIRPKGLKVRCECECIETDLELGHQDGLTCLTTPYPTDDTECGH